MARAVDLNGLFQWVQGGPPPCKRGTAVYTPEGGVWEWRSRATVCSMEEGSHGTTKTVLIKVTLKMHMAQHSLEHVGARHVHLYRKLPCSQTSQCFE
eukprot:1993166-Pyramimonas_sp.AAC.1